MRAMFCMNVGGSAIVLPRRKREASEMRERATNDDKREEPNEGWGGAVPGGTATRTGKRPTRAACVGVILVVRGLWGALSALTCGKRQTRVV